MSRFLPFPTIVLGWNEQRCWWDVAYASNDTASFMKLEGALEDIRRRIEHVRSENRKREGVLTEADSAPADRGGRGKTPEVARPLEPNE